MGRESQVDRESVRNFRQVMGSRVRRGEGWRQGASEEAGICGASQANALYLLREALSP